MGRMQKEAIRNINIGIIHIFIFVEALSITETSRVRMQNLIARFSVKKSGAELEPSDSPWG